VSPISEYGTTLKQFLQVKTHLAIDPAPSWNVRAGVRRGNTLIDVCTLCLNNLSILSTNDRTSYRNRVFTPERLALPRYSILAGNFLLTEKRVPC